MKNIEQIFINKYINKQTYDLASSFLVLISTYIPHIHVFVVPWDTEIP